MSRLSRPNVTGFVTWCGSILSLTAVGYLVLDQLGRAIEPRIPSSFLPVIVGAPSAYIASFLAILGVRNRQDLPRAAAVWALILVGAPILCALALSTLFLGLGAVAFILGLTIPYFYGAFGILLTYNLQKWLYGPLRSGWLGDHLTGVLIGIGMFLLFQVPSMFGARWVNHPAYQAAAFAIAAFPHLGLAWLRTRERSS